MDYDLTRQEERAAIEGMSLEPTMEPAAAASSRRVIKRYSNRKLYDTTESRYVTLAQIAEMVRAGEEVQVIDNATKEDKTEATLALILSEEVKTRPKAVPLGALRELVHTRGEKFLSQLREGPLGRFFAGDDLSAEGLKDATAAPVSPAPTEPTPAPPPAATPSQSVDGKSKAEPSKNPLQHLMESSRQTLEQWQAAIDERVQALLPTFQRDLQQESKRLAQRIEELEKRVHQLEGKGAETKK